MKKKVFAVFAAILTVCGCLGLDDNGGVDMSNKKILMVVAPNDFRDEELLTPKKIFEDAGVKVDVGSKDVTEARGVLGASVRVDVDIFSASAGDYDAVVFVGGGGAKIYFDDELANVLARDSVNSGKVTGAICIAPVILAKAGVLVNKRATVWTSLVDKSMVSVIEAGGGVYSPESVVVHGKIITACGPNAAEEFAEKILEKLSE
ncbi:MAG: DJ-1/PfpI family protein [Candidatus Altiarchaeota archaeon]